MARVRLHHDDGVGITGQGRISRSQAQRIGKRLRQQNPVEGVPVVVGKAGESIP